MDRLARCGCIMMRGLADGRMNGSERASIRTAICRTLLVRMIVDGRRERSRMPVAARKKRTTARGERLEARVSRETKALCQKAARIQGSTLTEFVVNCAVEAANRTIRDQEFAK